MKKENISNALNNIDFDMVEDTYDSIKQKKKNQKTLWHKWVGLAACFAIMLMAAVVVVPMMFGGDDPNDEYQYESGYFYQINEDAYSIYVGGKVIAEDKIGNKIADVNLTAGWKDDKGEWKSETEALRGEVYTINGVSNDVAIALKFIDQGEAVTTTHYYTLTHPNAEYNGTVFPDYIAENPVRYLEESSMGKSNGWQDFGLNGEIRTITVPVGSSYVYQMYSYYIRNDLKHIYWNEDLPDTLEKLPEWLSDSESAGRRTFWYSMGLRIPVDITVEATSEITSENGIIKFLKAEYTVQIKDGSNEKEEHWVIYFMEEDGVYSAYAVLANENFDFVKAYTEAIVKSYQIKK